VALRPGDLIDAAVASTGLDDFGAGPWRDGLDEICAALESEADLNALGWAVHQARFAHTLAQRLQVVDWHGRHPEIGAQAVIRPVIVTGLPRTGTTALAHLLAADPDSRALRTWEAGSPAPPPDARTEATDERIAATQAGIDMSHQLMPDLPRLYFATATSPSEALDLTGLSFRALQWGGQARVPAYEDWLLGADLAPAYEFQRRVHQLLQWRCPPARWTWKNPPDLFGLEAVRAAFPDALFVWTHREPFAVMASVASLVTVVRRLGTDAVDRVEIGRRQLDLWSEAVARGLAARDRLGEDAFADVYIGDLTRDPVATLGALYDRLGWTLTEGAERAMRDWLAGNPRHGRGGHDPDPATFGLAAGEIRDRFAGYCDRFEKEDW
jgi:hypothetical protein